MFIRPFNAVTTRVVLVGALLAAAAVLLLFALSSNSASAQVGGPIKYAENGEGPVRTFASTDPEGAGIAWDVTGLDAEDFTIDANGVLGFKKSPNYENPTDRARNESGTADNMYQIVIRATEKRPVGATRRALSTETDVTVEVTNMNEPGMVELQWLQPEVATPITATLTDPDGVTAGTVIWMWTVSTVEDPRAGADSDWRVATGTTSESTGGIAGDTYAPSGDCVDGKGASPTFPECSPTTDPDAPVDEDKFLRVTASYTDGSGASRTAVGVSANPVRAEVSSENDDIANPENGSPGFPPSGDYARSVPEDTGMAMSVGSPVVATDPDMDILTYELAASTAPGAVATDVDYFKIDKMTGQITVAKTLDYDENPNKSSPDGMYIVTVQATDPSGESDDVTVTITATNENDAPKISGSAELRVNEHDSYGMPGMPVRTESSTTIQANTYTAADQDEPDQVNWMTLEGEDAHLFEIISDNISGPSAPRDLKFKQLPDYEAPKDANGDNVYKVILVAGDDGGPETMADALEDRRAVTVFVDNVQEPGRITLSMDQPSTGSEVTATLEDPDNPEGDVANVTWQWFTGPDDVPGTDFTPIQGATTNKYIPVAANEGMFLRAEATYTDTLSASDNSETPRLDERVQKLDNTTVVAKDPALGDDLLYKVGATSKNAVKGGDPETPTDPATPLPPAFTAQAFERLVAENARVDDRVGDPVVATGATIGYTLSSGNDEDHKPFKIHASSGQITVADDDTTPTPADVTTRPDLDYEVKNIYVVEVTATDDAGRTGSATVTISLIDLNESPYLPQDSRDNNELPFPENRTGAVENYLATDPEGSGIRWEVTGPDADDFEITGGTLKFRTPPDYENPTDRDLNLNPSEDNDTQEDGEFEGGDNIYQVTVRATEMSSVGGGPAKSAELAVTVTVTNVDEDGTASLNWLQPEVGTEITAAVTDPDGNVTSPNHQWYRSKVDPPDPDPDPAANNFTDKWELITGATRENYTPVAPADEGKHLLVVISYTDPIDSGRSAVATSAHPVQADVPDDINNSPDFSEAMTDRTVPENTGVGEAVGARVVVDINEDDDTLTYEIVATDRGNDGNSAVVTGDVEYFSIDKESGQLRVKKTLSHEANDGRDYTATPSPGMYTIVVRATDPSGEGDNENRDDITVTIIATDVNEAPRVVSGMAEISINELDEGDFIGLPNPLANDPGDNPADPDYPTSTEANYHGDPDMNLYKREDEDSNESHTWELKGDDSALFQFGTPHDGIGRRIFFRNAPDYEDPKDANRDNVYEVTVVVIDNDGARGEKAVRVEVRNVDEMGKLKLLPKQPILGDEITPALEDHDGIMTASDGDQTITSWQWYWTTTDIPLPDSDGDGEVDQTAVDAGTAGKYLGTTEDTYMTTDADVGRYLHVRVTYRDGHNREDDPVTPIITLDERDGDSTASPVIPADPDRVLTAKTDNAVLQEAPGGPPVVHVNAAPAFSAGPFDFWVAENTPSTGYVGAPIVATDAEDDAAGTALDYDIGGPDADTFTLAPIDDGDPTNGDEDAAYYADSVERNTGLGQIVVKPVTHFDYEFEQEYTVELSAIDSDGERTTTEVTVWITNVNEAPSEPKAATAGLPITGPAQVSYAENGTGAVETYQVVGAELRRLTWSLLAGDDAAAFTITREGESEGVLTFKTPPDFENPTDADENNSYQLTVTARVTTGQFIEDLVPLPVTVTVTNVDEEGGVTLSALNNAGGEVSLGALDEAGQETMAGVSPVAGREVTATLSDYDKVTVGATTWQWAITDALDLRWTDIAGETADKYTPVDSDVGKYLRATANYTDGHGSGKAESVISSPVVSITSPAFASATAARELAESAAAGEYVGDPVTATDADGDMPVYALSGADAAFFDIDSATGQIMVGSGTTLNFEDKDTYVVTVEARDNRDGDGNTVTGEAADATIDVIIEVVDVDEAGIVASLDRPVVGTELTADVQDPDGVSDELWQWARSDAANDGSDESLWDDINGAQSPAYTPAEADFDKYLRVLVNYTDNHGKPKREFAVSGQVVMVSSPAFAEDMAAREVAENTAAGEYVGDPVTATDADGDMPVYALSGTDAASFTIDSATGQLMTSAALDFETQDTYMVTVEARDNEDADGNADIGEAADNTITVTITVTNMDEDGMVALSAAPVVGIELTATLEDPDAEVTNITWQWAKSDMADGTYADIEGATSETYTPTMDDLDMYLRVMASYDDGVGDADTAMAAPDNAVVSFSSPEFADGAATAIDVEENTAAGAVIDSPTATDADGDAPVYTMSGTDAASFDIDSATGQITVGSGTSLDFETKDTYMVTVEARDNEDAMGEPAPEEGADNSIDVTINVTNVEEMGTVTLDSDQPMVGTALTASVTDPDVADQGTVMWQWASSATMAGPFTEISGATTDASYTPVAGDAGMYLQATATYNDGEGSGRMSMAVTVNAVTAEEVFNAYDLDQDGQIDRDEYYRAITAYFEPGSNVSKAEVETVIDLYLGF